MLMRCTSSSTNESLSYNRWLGAPDGSIICFLPWRISLTLARRSGLISESFLACYELPNGTVSSEPAIAAQALMAVVDDACALILDCGKSPSELTIVGLSLGSGPATLLANRFSCRLISVASADRGDRMLWESPAVTDARDRAIKKGYALEDYTQALEGLNPIDNLAGIAPESVFVVGETDLYVPKPRRRALVEEVTRQTGDAKIIHFPHGHARTITHAMREIDQLAS